MLPMPLTRVWSSSARLSPVRRRRSAAANAASSNAGSSGSRAMCATGTRHAVRRRSDDGQPAERALVDEAQLRAAVGEREPDPQVRLVRASRLPHQQLAAHAEVGEHARRRRPSQRQPQVLAAPAGAGRGCGRASRDGEVVAAAGVPAYRAGVGDVDVGDGAAGDPPLEAAADDLDLGQLRHGLTVSGAD